MQQQKAFVSVLKGKHKEALLTFLLRKHSSVPIKCLHRIVLFRRYTCMLTAAPRHATYPTINPKFSTASLTAPQPNQPPNQTDGWSKRHPSSLPSEHPISVTVFLYPTPSFLSKAEFANDSFFPGVFRFI